MYKSILSPHNNSISVKGIIWICTLNWVLFSRLHCSASYSNIYSVRPNTISILFLFINGILNVARFQNCATLVDISKVQKRAASRISLSLERTLLFQSCLQLSFWCLSTSLCNSTDITPTTVLTGTSTQRHWESSLQRQCPYPPP